MTLPIVWTAAASAQLADLYAYIAESSAAAAEKQVEAVLDATARLSGFPELGRRGRCKGARELVVHGTPYIVAYRIRLSTVEVLTVMHGARRWPRSFAG